jgi:hypothetical protein
VFKHGYSRERSSFQDGAFDEAVKGVDAVEHTASPFNTQFDDPQGELIAELWHERSLRMSQRLSGLPCMGRHPSSTACSSTGTYLLPPFIRALHQDTHANISSTFRLRSRIIHHQFPLIYAFVPHPPSHDLVAPPSNA